MAIFNLLSLNDEPSRLVIQSIKDHILKSSNRSIVKVTESVNTESFFDSIKVFFGFNFVIGILPSNSGSYICTDITDATKFEIAKSIQSQLSKKGISIAVDETYVQESSLSTAVRIKIILKVAESDLANNSDAIAEVLIATLASPEIVNDPDLDIARWVEDEKGAWLYRGMDNALIRAYIYWENLRNMPDVENFADNYFLGYRVSKNLVHGKTQTLVHYFDKDGYAVTTCGFIKASKSDKALYIMPNGQVGFGWILIDNYWHLFNDCAFSEYFANIDGTFYNLGVYGKLDMDSNLFIRDNDNPYILHRLEKAHE